MRTAPDPFALVDQLDPKATRLVDELEALVSTQHPAVALTATWIVFGACLAAMTDDEATLHRLLDHLTKKQHKAFEGFHEPEQRAH